MKLLVFEVKTSLGRLERLGALQNGSIVDLNFAAAFRLASQGKADALLPPYMIPFLELGEPALEEARQTLGFMRGKPETSVGPEGGRILYPESGPRRLSPVPRPGALRDFFAFEEHAKQGAARRGEPLAPEWYDQPVYYKGNHREIYGPGDTVPWPNYTRKLDFELEIACVVGKKGRDLSPEEAAQHIAGFTILNDWSARDIQKNEMVCRMGPAKGKDFAFSLGPHLLTTDELGGEPENLAMSVWVNGEKWSESDSSGRYWSFAVMLSHVSQSETVYPGDVLGSGTYFQGCGLDLGRWIKPGDKVELKVDKLGTLSNIVGAPSQAKHLKYSKDQAKFHVAHR